MKEKYYITTSIAYTTAKPHIGNVYEIVLTDAIARHKRNKGFDVYFQTGTDEHGQKVEEKANLNNQETQNYADLIASEIKSIWDLMNTTYDNFVRTTDKHHIEVVQRIFKKLYDQGDIYLGEYEGWYCSPCEAFYTETQLVNNNCPECNSIVKKTKEEAYFFKMSKYQDRLMKHYEDNPDFIKPVSRKNEMVNNFLKPGLQDLCVSRTSFKWGVPVTFNEKHIVYVWIDALSNYITNIGYDVDKVTDEFRYLWPADLHVVGKDIIRFHIIYWPIILMALDLPLPKQIYGHPWLLSNNDKIGKSKNNAVYADDLVKLFGVDAVRYFLLHEMSFDQDGNYTLDLIIDTINSDLVNNLGNLVSRTFSMATKYFEGNVSNKQINNDIHQNFIKKINVLEDNVKKQIDDLHIQEAINKVIEVLDASNKYIDETTPWILAKDDTKKDELETVIYNLLEAIRVSALELDPFIPETSKKIIKGLNTNDYESKYKEESKYNIQEIEHLFTRIDKEIIKKEIN